MAAATARSPKRKKQPQPKPAPPATAPAPPVPPVPTQAQLIAAIVTALASAFTVAGVVAALGALMAAIGVGYLALAAVAALVLSWPAERMEGTGPASRWAVRTNALRRAQFFLAACKRVQAAVVRARSHGEPVTQAIRDAIAAERRYMAQMIMAATQRMRAASAVDGMASTYGNLLGWNTVLTPTTTLGCKRANGMNFRADQPPIVEGSPSYPGAVHAQCRCFPSAPFKGAPVLP